MRTLNLGILAHVDAGKTTLTERLLHTAGVIDKVGSVDDGSTHTDTLPLERARGITIKSAVVSFRIDDVKVNLIDTPGHPDFIAEVERVLSVLDGVVLVVSAVEGVQPQTRILMRTLRRLHLPTLIFVNKIDRAGARYAEVLRGISDRLTSNIVAMGSVEALGTRRARWLPHNAADSDFLATLTNVLADFDDSLLAAYVEDETAVPYARLRRQLAAQTRLGLVQPVFFGSAITAAGIDALTAGITELLPAAEPDPDGAPSATVFKIQRGPAGERIAYVRLFSGTLRARDRVRLPGRERDQRITAISVFDNASEVRRASIIGGEIGMLWGLGDVQVGDTIGSPPTTAGPHHFAPPTLETVVAPGKPADKGALHVALTQLAEQDPLIDVRQDDVRQELSVSLYGEVQKQVVEATLADDFGIEVTFRDTTVICIERPIGTGAAVERIATPPNPFLATVGLRVEPGPTGSGVRYQLEVELGSMPYAFMRAVEDTVRQTLTQGLFGWQVTDCLVTMTHSGYWPRQSHAHQGFDKSMSSTGADFRGLTPLVVMAALRQAGTRVYEPAHRFRLEAPTTTLAVVLQALARLQATSQAPILDGSACTIEGHIPARRVHELQQQLPGLTRGEGLLESAFDHYQPVRDSVPTRPRSDHNPLNRKEYLLQVLRGGGLPAGR